MSSSSGSFNAAIPVGILGGIVVLMFAFIWWWFPRHWRKGVSMDMAEIDEDRRQRDLQADRMRVGSETSTDVGVAVPEAVVHARPKHDEEMAMGAGQEKNDTTTATMKYVPPPVTSY